MHATENRMKNVRLAKGWTQLQLSITAKVERALVSMLENGKQPSQRTATRIATALGVKPEKLWPDFQSLWRG